MQRNSSGTVQYWQRIQFQILVNLPKWYIQIFDEDSDRSSHHYDLENQWLQVEDYDEDTGDQNGKPSTLPYPFPYTQRIIFTSITFCQPLSMHRLQSTFNKVKKENPQVGSNTDLSGTDWQSYWYANRRSARRDY